MYARRSQGSLWRVLWCQTGKRTPPGPQCPLRALVACERGEHARNSNKRTAPRPVQAFAGLLLFVCGKFDVAVLFVRKIKKYVELENENPVTCVRPLDKLYLKRYNVKKEKSRFTRGLSYLLCIDLESHIEYNILLRLA